MGVAEEGSAPTTGSAISSVNAAVGRDGMTIAGVNAGGMTAARVRPETPMMKRVIATGTCVTIRVRSARSVVPPAVIRARRVVLAAAMEGRAAARGSARRAATPVDAEKAERAAALVGVRAIGPAGHLGQARQAAVHSVGAASVQGRRVPREGTNAPIRVVGHVHRAAVTKNKGWVPAVSHRQAVIITCKPLLMADSW